MARAAQFRVAADERVSLRLAPGIVEAKIRNQRTLLRRNWKYDAVSCAGVLDRLQHLICKTPQTHKAQLLLGIEGEATSLYFGAFERMIVPDKPELPAFGFATRNRRPPTDPVNAMLSFAYPPRSGHWEQRRRHAGADEFPSGPGALRQAFQGHAVFVVQVAGAGAILFALARQLAAARGCAVRHAHRLQFHWSPWTSPARFNALARIASVGHVNRGAHRSGGPRKPGSVRAYEVGTGRPCVAHGVIYAVSRLKIAGRCGSQTRSSPTAGRETARRGSL